MPLPAELVDLIISSLYPIPLKHGNGSRNFLNRSTAVIVGKCALVCRDWVPSSRRILFYRVHIKHYTAYTFAKLFYRAQRLTFLPFIRELEFRNGIAEDRWMHTIFPRIAKHLPSSIRTLALSVSRYPVQDLPRPPLRAITRLEIVETHYSFVGLAEIVLCLASFPALEEAKIWLADNYIWGSNVVRLPPTTLGVPEGLRSLDLRYRSGIEPFLEWIHTTGPALSTLDLSFALRQTQPSIKYATEYIKSLGPSLTSLSLSFDDFNSTRDFDPDPLFHADFLRRNTHLQALTIRSSPSRTISLLRKMHFPPVLHSLTIWVPAKLLSLDWPPNHSESLPWNDLDSIMSPLRAVDRLRVVYFGDADITRELQLDAHPSYLRLKLPLFVARGTVTEEMVDSPFP
ncbi:hypothetical protein FB451DRAFT_1227986 [Mycena latifolia]|nr:hypothetical protein FB451DRAFT_1227986 [Mycena latifolia]